MLAVPGGAATILVTPATAVAAFNAATAGDVLKLSGNFSGLRLGNRSFSRTVTLDLSQAVFTNTLLLTAVTNLKVTGGKFDITKDVPYTKAASVVGGSNVWFDRTTILGATGEQGIVFAGTTNASVSNGRFDGLRSAVILSEVTTGSATRNRVTHSLSDGIDIADSHGVSATYNTCSLSVPAPGAHPDCIQLWSVTGHALQSDNNVSYNTATGYTQGFTSFSAGGGGLRLTISHNVVNTSLSQGVACYECFDSNISFNTLTTLPGAAHLTNLSVLGGTGNTVVGNTINPFPVAGSHFADLIGPDEGAGAIPEPSTWAMLLAGFAAVGLARRRRQPMHTA